MAASSKPGPLTSTNTKIDCGTLALTKHQPPGPCMFSKTEYFSTTSRMSQVPSNTHYRAGRTDNSLMATIATTISAMEKNSTAFASMLKKIKYEIRSDLPFTLINSRTSGAYSKFKKVKNSAGKEVKVIEYAKVYISRTFDNYFYPTTVRVNNYNTVITNMVARCDLPSIIFHEVSHIYFHSVHSSRDVLVKTSQMGHSAGFGFSRADPAEVMAIDHTNRLLREPYGLPPRTNLTISTLTEYEVEKSWFFGRGGYTAVKHRFDPYNNKKIRYHRTRGVPYKPISKHSSDIINFMGSSLIIPAEKNPNF